MVSFCRLCASLRRSDVLIIIRDNSNEICEKLRKCCALDINMCDTLPKSICQECIENLNSSYKFYTKVKEAQEALHALFPTSSTHKESDKEEATQSPPVQPSLMSTKTAKENEDEQSIPVQLLSLPKQARIEEPYTAIKPVQNNTKENIEVSLKQNKLENCLIKNTKDVVKEPLANKTNKDLIQEVSDMLQITKEETICESSYEIPENDDKDIVDLPVEPVNVSENKTVSTTTMVVNTKSKRTHIFKCDVCGAKFIKAFNLQKHLEKTHDATQFYICNKCGHHFSLETEFCKHFENCSYLECNTELSTARGNRKVNTKFVKAAETENNRNCCMYCKRYFPTPAALRTHLRTHTGERPFQCKYCTKSFKTKSQLNVHHKRHTGQADFICSVCNKTFYEQSNLTDHMYSHTDERLHVCTICNKSYNRVYSLQFHMRTHNGEKRFNVTTVNDQKFSMQQKSAFFI